MKKIYHSDFQNEILSRLLLILVISILASSATFGQTAAINDPGLNETNLDAGVVTITLTAETFLDATLDAGNFTLNNAPAGLTIESVVYGTTTSADVNLTFTPGDFDTDVSNFSINIDNTELTVTAAGVLTTNEITISADDESATMQDPSLNEGTLDNQSVIIDLLDETFDASLEQGNFTLVGFPPGLSIESVTRNNSMRATVNLAFDGTDFDINYTDFYITIAAADLVQTSSGVLVPDNRLTVVALVENPTALLTPGTALRESNLDGSILNITLDGGESFINPGNLLTGNFVPANAPPGLSVQSLSNPGSTSVDLTLGFTGTDFDVDYNDFHILINAAVLVQSSENLATNPVAIAHEVEPVITNVSIPNDTMGIDDNIPVTITVEDDGGNVFTLVGGQIGGYTLVGLERVDATTYTSNFPIEVPGNSYAASQDIPVTNVQFMNGAIAGNVYSGYIIQANDLLDANAPVIQYIYSNTGGAQNIGSEIFLRIRATEGALSFTPISHVNNVLVSSPNIEITESSGNIYNVRYLVAEGDNNVNPGEITVSMTAVDLAGNSSTTFTAIDPTPTLSIDASRPAITSAYVSSTDEDIIVGETVEIVITADQPGYRNLTSDSWINGIYVDPPGTNPPHLTFTDLGNGSYLYAYTVHENDGAVSRGELTINIVLQDAAPFSNTNFPWTDLNENNVQIETNRPSASISGTTEICYGDSALITVILGGTSPWTIDIYDGTSITQHSSSTSPYTFAVYPEVSTVYTVDRVEDGTGNYNDEGAGQATITVHPLPNVQINNLDGLYDIASPPVVLTYTPSGGTFTGPGISPSPPWTFDPEDAGVSPEGLPHEIEYTVMDANGCINSDIQEVIVVSGSSVINFEKPAACFNDASFLITGSNVAGSIGTFSVQPALPASVFEDQEDNTAILRPDLYGITMNLNLTIYYTYEDLSGQDIATQRQLTIEYLDAADINEPPDLEPCQNDNLIALSGNYATGYIFTGSSGVVDTLGGDYFNPELADTGTNLIVYEYTSTLQCQVSDSLELMVLDAPDAGFIVAEPCIPLGGGQVQFESRSDTNVSWLWNFGDPESGFGNNRSTDENPWHHYEDTGSYTVSLSVVSNNGCDDLDEKTIDIHASPVADFSWNSNCQTDAPILMTGKETVYSPDIIANFTWKIDSAGTEIFSSDTGSGQLSYKFSSVGTYSVRYKVTTNAFCADSIDKSISLSPTILLSPDSPYSEDFELAGHGWISGILDPSKDQNSWTDTVVNPNEFPIDAASGTRAWYTARPEVGTYENSWVLSPCFNFEGFYRPMVSLSIKRSLHRNKDGAALQYTINNGMNWKNVGDVDDGGINWYNSREIIPDVGKENTTGWTGELVPEEDPDWVMASHGLDQLYDKPEVRFRVAFGSWNDARTETNDGFAFDNFKIKQRSRLTVLEYFTNANNPDCDESDTLIMEIMNQVPADVIDIQYHAMGSQADGLYLDNPVPANSRSSIYGVTSIPYAILDGNFMTYNFSTSGTSPNVEDIRRRSLEDPDFKLMITVTQYPTPSDNTLKFTCSMEALRDLERKERTLYAIVLQRKVDDPKYEGTNGLTVFRHVARRMLPDNGGFYIGPKDWTEGESKEAEFTDGSSFYSKDEDNITIAVFMQDDETGEILQAVTKPEYVVSTFDEPETLSRVLIYPNPARELVNVYFEETPMEEMRFSLYNLSGKMVITDLIGPWQQQFTRTLNDLEKGIYIIEIRTGDRKRVIYRDKLLHY